MKFKTQQEVDLQWLEVSKKYQETASKELSPAQNFIDGKDCFKLSLIHHLLERVLELETSENTDEESIYWLTKGRIIEIRNLLASLTFITPIESQDQQTVKLASSVITKESLEGLGYSPFHSAHLDYENGNLLTFSISRGVDMYYQRGLQFCKLVTGDVNSRGTRVLFEGKIETTEQLEFVIKSVNAYNNLL